jgi:hypothetical protein
MRYLTATAASYAGVDLHASSLHLCVLDSAGTVRLSRKLKAQPQPFLEALAPFRPVVTAVSPRSALAVVTRAASRPDGPPILPWCQKAEDQSHPRRRRTDVRS